MTTIQFLLGLFLDVQAFLVHFAYLTMFHHQASYHNLKFIHRLFCINWFVFTRWRPVGAETLAWFWYGNVGCFKHFDEIFHGGAVVEDRELRINFLREFPDSFGYGRYQFFQLIISTDFSLNQVFEIGVIAFALNRHFDDLFFLL